MLWKWVRVLSLKMYSDPVFSDPVLSLILRLAEKVPGADGEQV